jgi:uncharacterized repeat protein (TIGR01451 family)
MDLLTVLIHELGHVIGLSDLPADEYPDQIMAGELPVGVRRLPAADFRAVQESTGTDAHTHGQLRATQLLGETTTAPAYPTELRVDRALAGTLHAPLAGDTGAAGAHERSVDTRIPVVAPLPQAIAGVDTSTQRTGLAAPVAQVTPDVTVGPFDLPAGKAITITFQAVIDEPVPIGTTQVENQARVTADGVAEILSDDPDTPAANDATVTALDVEADLAITKTDNQTEAVPGEPVTYSVVVTNNGPNPAGGATVTDNFSADLTGVTWTCAAGAGNSCTGSGSGDISDAITLTVGSSVTYTANATIDSAATGSLANTASVAVPAGVSDPIPTNNSATDSNALTPEVDIVLTKTESADPVTAGSGAGNLTYTITASNSGPSDATGVTISETITTPAGVAIDSITPSAGSFISPTWTIPDLDVGASEALTIVLTVDASTAAGTDTIADTATVTGAGQTLVNTGDDVVTEATSITREVDVEVTMSESADPVTAGSGTGNLAYVVIAANLGPSDASGVVLTDTLALPAGVTLDSVTPAAPRPGTAATPGRWATWSPAAARH